MQEIKTQLMKGKNLQELKRKPINIATLETVNVRNLQKKDEECRRIYESVKNKNGQILIDPGMKKFAKKCKIEDGILFYEKAKQNLIVSPESMIPRLIAEAHQDLLTHPGWKKVKERIQRKWTWRNIEADVKGIVQACD